MAVKLASALSSELIRRTPKVSSEADMYGSVGFASAALISARCIEVYSLAEENWYSARVVLISSVEFEVIAMSWVAPIRSLMITS